MKAYYISILIIFSIFFSIKNLSAQSQFQYDNRAWLQQQSAQATAHITQVSYNNTALMENKQVGAFARYNPITLMLKGSMWMYQNAFSPQLGKRCSFEMSCSNFSKNSIKEYGIFKGLALSADRILRCNKISYLDISPLEIDEHSHRIKDFPIDYRWQKSEVAAE